MQAKNFVLLQQVIPKRAITWLAGLIGKIEIAFIKNYLINKFVAHFGIDLSQFNRTSPQQYQNFNDFFTRELKPNSRPLTAGKNGVISPVDGQISQIGCIESNRLLQAKSHYYLLNELVVNDQQIYEKYLNGHFATMYLAPNDYHRVHMPFDGTLGKSIYVPGKLFSVNQATTQELPGLFTGNERLVCEFNCSYQNKAFSMLIILVGAMIVSGIETVWSPKNQGRRIRIKGHPNGSVSLKKGDELGRFNAGSTVILMFPKDTISWTPSLKAKSPVKMGRQLADLTL